MLLKIFEFFQKWWKWIVFGLAILVLGIVLISCQGLFNVNAKESNVDVSLVDSLNLKGGSK
jgi:hypothetical protein